MNKHLKALAMLIGCGMSAATAQVGPITTTESRDTTLWYQNKAIFQNVETSRISSGILLDYGTEFIDISVFNGQQLTDRNLVSFGTLEQINATLNTATIRAVQPALLTPQELYNRRMANIQKNQLRISGILYEYQRYDSTKKNNVTITNNKIYDKYVQGQWQNPYKTERVFAMALPVSRINGRSFTFTLPANLWQSNLSTPVSSVQVDAGDGQGWRSVAMGGSMNVTYTTTGLKKVKFKVTLPGGIALESHSPLEVLIPLGATADAVIPFTGSESYEGGVTTARVSIDYAPGHGTTLRKPLIIVEGFDPGDVISPEDMFGMTNIQEFFEEGIENVGTLNKLNIELNSGAYDRIYIDWNNGTDYLERNAILLQDIIKWVNDNKVGTEENVVWGFSMGGLIGRYALKDLEDDGYDHETRLFISHDAPHLGANVPAGAQAMADHLRSYFIGSAPVTSPFISILIPLTGSQFVENALRLAERPAAAEMLINQYNASLQGVHYSWQNKLRLKGYPSCETVAIANGSECAFPQPFNPGDNLMHLTGKANTAFVADITITTLAFAYPINGILSSVLAEIGVSPLLSLLPGSSQMSVDFSVNTNNHLSSKEIYKGKISYKKTILWIIPITQVLTTRSVSQSETYTWDRFPGGTYPLGWLGLEDMSASASEWWAGSYDLNLELTPTFTFVPVASALDIGMGATSLPSNIYERKYIGALPPAAPYNTPFDNFATAYSSEDIVRNNEDHTAITSRNASFVGNELAGTPIAANCENACLDKEISGDEFVCRGSSKTFSIPFTTYPGSTDNITWSAIPSMAVTLSPSGNTCVVSNPSTSAVTTVTIRANVSTQCGVTTFEKVIRVGQIPTFEIDFILAYPGTGDNCSYTPVISPTCHAGIESITWSGTGAPTLNQTEPDAEWVSCWSSKGVYVSSPFAPVQNVYATVNTACGVQTLSTTFDIDDPSCYEMRPGTGAMNSSLNLYPNPTTNNWELAIPDAWSGRKVMVSVYSIDGKKLAQHTTYNNLYTIDAGSLAQGVYIIQVDNGVEQFTLKGVKK